MSFLWTWWCTDDGDRSFSPVYDVNNGDDYYGSLELFPFVVFVVLNLTRSTHTHTSTQFERTRSYKHKHSHVRAVLLSALTYTVNHTNEEICVGAYAIENGHRCARNGHWLLFNHLKVRWESDSYQQTKTAVHLKFPSKFPMIRCPKCWNFSFYNMWFTYNHTHIHYKWRKKNYFSLCIRMLFIRKSKLLLNFSMNIFGSKIMYRHLDFNFNLFPFAQKSWFSIVGQYIKNLIVCLLFNCFDFLTEQYRKANLNDLYIIIFT